jgi:hypothetical protein
MAPRSLALLRSALLRSAPRRVHARYDPFCGPLPQTHRKFHDAARRLGVSEDAVRMRVKRGTLSSAKEGGRLYVLLDAEPTVDRTDELIEELRGRVQSLEDQLGQERDANRENGRIIAALTSRIPAIEAPSDMRESPERVEGEPERESPGPVWERLRRAQSVPGGGGGWVSRRRGAITSSGNPKGRDPQGIHCEFIGAWFHMMDFLIRREEIWGALNHNRERDKGLRNPTERNSGAQSDDRRPQRRLRREGEPDAVQCGSNENLASAYHISDGYQRIDARQIKRASQDRAR